MTLADETMNVSLEKDLPKRKMFDLQFLDFFFGFDFSDETEKEKTNTISLSLSS